ncbi:magnesium/cobalt transporter CorA [Thermococcus sp.]
MSEKPRITVFAYSKDRFEGRKVESLENALEFKNYSVVWVNIDGFEDLNGLKEVFGFHDAVFKALRRSKGRIRAMVFGDYLFLLLYQIYELPGGLKRERTAIFLKDNFVITIQERPGDVFNPVRESIRKGEGLFREKGADYLLFALLDAVVENYIPMLERISSRMEELESKILKRADEETLRRIHRIRREILFMRRTIFPLLETFRKLEIDAGEFFEEETRGYLDELHEHIMEILEVVESHREMANGLIEMYYSTISMKTNEIIRILTVVSTIFIPLTFITGVYGMNFRYMPELSWRYGYFGTLAGMLLIALGMLQYFRRKGWL